MYAVFVYTGRYVSHVDRWCQHNHMSINSDKSNVMFISSRQNRQIL